MRLLPLLFALLLAAAPLPVALLGDQDPPETPPEEEEPRPGLTAHREEERARVEAALEGTWMLLRYDPPAAIFDPTNVQGVAVFQDGYLSLTVMAQTFQPEFFGDGVQLFVQGGAHRYRVNELGELQTAAIMSFHNFDDEELLQVEASGSPREYTLEIDETGTTLRMTKADGTALSWSRLGETEFPADAAEALDRVRGKVTGD